MWLKITGIYQFGGKIYHQVSGSPIGTRFSMSTSQVVMCMWDIDLNTIMKKENLDVETKLRFVDDLHLYMYGINHGWRWENNQMMFRFSWLEEDIGVGLTTQEITTREMKKMMNSIYPHLKFEMETEYLFKN